LKNHIIRNKLIPTYSKFSLLLYILGKKRT